VDYLVASYAEGANDITIPVAIVGKGCNRPQGQGQQHG
jgi:hypothetical protein